MRLMRIFPGSVNIITYPLQFQVVLSVYTATANQPLVYTQLAGTTLTETFTVPAATGVIAIDAKLAQSTTPFVIPANASFVLAYTIINLRDSKGAGGTLVPYIPTVAMDFDFSGSVAMETVLDAPTAIAPPTLPIVATL